MKFNEHIYSEKLTFNLDILSQILSYIISKNYMFLIFTFLCNVYKPKCYHTPFLLKRV